MTKQSYLPIERIDESTNADGYRVALTKCGSTYHVSVSANDGFLLVNRFYSSKKQATNDFNLQKGQPQSRAVEIV